MNCETLRARLTEDPAAQDADFDSHAKDCAPCRAYRARLNRAESLIHDAVRFDIDAVVRGVETESAQRAASSNNAWVAWASGFAAALLVGVTFWAFLGGRALTPEALASEVVDHWYHEPESWVRTDDPVAVAVLADVLEGEAAIGPQFLSTVSYAETCWVAGEWVPHLVVQSQTGPYMILLMPERVLQSPVPLELPEEGLSGRIVPAGQGSIAILGSGPAADVDRLQESLVSTVDWII